MQVSKLRTSSLSSAGKHFCRSITASVSADNVEAYDDVTLKSWRDIPGPSSLPLIGSSRHFYLGGMFQKLNAFDLMTKAFNTYGPIVKVDNIIGLPHTIFLEDPESVSQILRGENHLPVRIALETRTYYKKNLNNVKEGRPAGLTSENGELWKELRSAASPVLLQPKIIKNYTSALNKVAVEMIDRIKALRDKKDGIKTELNEELNLWALESTGLVALGRRLGCLDPLPEDSPQSQLISSNYDLLVLSYKLDFKPSIVHLFATPNFKKVMRATEIHERFSEYFTNQMIEEHKTKSKSDDEKGVIEKLLQTNAEFAQIVATDMLFAGVHAVTNSVLPILYLLAVNPDKQAKLREELRSSQENKPYLKACLKESLRLMPPISSSNRVTTRDYNLLGYKIPPGIKIVFAHHCMALKEEHYPRAKEFLPERWLVKNNDPLHYKQAHPFAYSAFGSGVRSCIGRRIAELELELITARLVENFQIEWFGPPPEIETHILNYFKGPFNFIFNDAPQ